MNILAISGSLRRESSHAVLLRAVQRLAPASMAIVISDDVGRLPHFNPDLDGGQPPPAVAEFRSRMARVDGVIISSPEYAHGVPGSLKNALDWLVSGSEVVGKPVLLINASPSGGRFAQESLTRILSVMTMRVLVEDSLAAPVVRKAFDAQGRIVDPRVESALSASLAALEAAVEVRSG